MRGAHIAALLIVFLASHLILLDSHPFYRDEALYAQSIDEFIISPSIFPTYFGKVFTWKPMLLFYAYSPAVFLLRMLPIPLEAAYRLPSMFFGLASAFLVYGISRRMKLGESQSLLAAMVYAGSNLAAVVETSLLIDPLLNSLILAGLYSYLRAKEDARWLASAFAFGALAFLAKTFAAVFLPLLALLLFFFTDRKCLQKPAFLLSLCGPAFGALIYTALFFATGNSGLLLTEYAFDASRLPLFSSALLSKILLGGMQLVFFTLPWIFLAGYGVLKADFRKGGDAFLGYWLFLILLPLSTAYVLYWYFLPILPVLALFAARGLAPDGKLDRMTAAMFIAMLAISLYAAPYLGYARVADEDRELGEYLGGKERVLIVANYSSTILFYKSHQEPTPFFNSTRVVFHTNTSKIQPEEMRAIVYSNSLPLNSSYSFQNLIDIYLARDAVADGPALDWDYVALDSNLYEAHRRLLPDFHVDYRTQGLKYAVLKRNA